MTGGERFVIPAGHPALAGHFPDRPVVPGAVILDQVIAAWGGPCLGVPIAKFHAPLGPDQPVEVRFAPTLDAGVVRFGCWRSDQVICSGQIRVAATR